MKREIIEEIERVAREIARNGSPPYGDYIVNPWTLAAELRRRDSLVVAHMARYAGELYESIAPNVPLR